MTRLAICRKCKKVFFTNIRGKYGLRCPQRDCRSEDVKAWSVRLINRLGSELLQDLFPQSKFTVFEPEPGIKPKPEISSLPRRHAGRPKKDLTSEIIENFHRRYRQNIKGQEKRREFNPRIPIRYPSHSTVKRWLIGDGTGEKLANRWATELLENHIPKEYQKTE